MTAPVGTPMPVDLDTLRPFATVAIPRPRCATCRWAVERLHDSEELPLICTRADADGALIETNDGSYPGVAPTFGCVQWEGKDTPAPETKKVSDGEPL